MNIDEFLANHPKPWSKARAVETCSHFVDANQQLIPFDSILFYIAYLETLESKARYESASVDEWVELKRPKCDYTEADMMETLRAGGTAHFSFSLDMLAMIVNGIDCYIDENIVGDGMKDYRDLYCILAQGYNQSAGKRVYDIERWADTVNNRPVL